MSKFVLISPHGVVLSVLFDEIEAVKVARCTANNYNASHVTLYIEHGDGARFAHSMHEVNVYGDIDSKDAHGTSLKVPS